MSKQHKGEKAFWFGKKMPLEARQNMSKAHLGLNALEKHPNWLGGKSFEPYSPEFNNQLKELIRTRDGYRCQLCFKHQDELFTKKGKSVKLSVHHIDYNKLNCMPNNLISLCKSCHTKTNCNRAYWTNYFNLRYNFPQCDSDCAANSARTAP